MHRIVPVLLFSCIGSCLYAQPARAVFDHYGPEQGFSTRTSRTVVKTSQGMVWITTDDGLARFDSETFRFYRHDPADSQSLASNMTDEMVADREDHLWLVAGTGLDKFDPATGRFTHCAIREGNGLVRDFRPEALCYDKSRDRVWVATWQGLYFSERGATLLRKAPADPASASFAGMTFNAITQDAMGFLWLGNTYGFFRYDPLTGTITRFHIPGQDDRLEDDDGVFSLYADPAGVLWIGTWNKGLVRYDIQTGKAEQFYYSDPARQQNGIVAIAATGLTEEKDIIWVSAVNLGLGTFNYKTRSFTSYATPLEKDKHGVKGRTNRLLPTRSEGMWIAAEDGLHRYDYASQLFKEIQLGTLDPLLQQSLPSESLCFIPSRNGGDSLCWLNVPYVGPFVYDFGKQKLTPAPAPAARYFSGSVFTMYADKAGVLWISTDKFGLVGVSLSTGQTVWPAGTHFTGDWTWVRSFLEDRQQRLWLATYEGLFLVDKERKDLTPVRAVNDPLREKRLSLQVAGMDEDEKGRIWFTTQGGNGEDALGYYDAASGRVGLYHYREHRDRGFPVKPGLANIVCAGPEVYAGSREGLLRISLAETLPRFQLLTTREGLSNNRVEQVVKDAQSNIWCSTVFGVSCYLPSRNFFMNYYGSSTGLGPQKTPSLFVSPYTDVIYVSQPGFLNYFDPRTITIDPAPSLLFTGIQVFNKPYEASFLPGETIHLRHDQNMITVEFAAMSFRNADNNQYAYRLEGLEPDWTYTKKSTVSFTNLAPGRYTLWVKAANSSGVWTPQPLSLGFVIRPPFWKTGWFILLCVLTAAAMVYVIARARIRAIRERYALRNKIAADLHDEIGSTLTSIHILSSVSQQAMEQHPGKAREMLEQITSQSQMIQQNMSDIVWAIRPDNDKVENLLVRMREYAARTLEPLNIRTVILIGDELLPYTLPLQARKELLLIFKEAVNNIARHSGASVAEIGLKKEGGSLALVIRDNGTWKEGNHSGTGSRSMRQRAQSLGGALDLSYDASGTTVTATIPLT